VLSATLAEQQGYAWTDLRGWLPDLLAGWTPPAPSDYRGGHGLRSGS